MQVDIKMINEQIDTQQEVCAICAQAFREDFLTGEVGVISPGRQWLDKIFDQMKLSRLDAICGHCFVSVNELAWKLRKGMVR